MTYQFIVRDSQTLCMDGYPIQVIRKAPASYHVVVEGKTVAKVITLNTAKQLAVSQAKEIDVFMERAP